MDYFFTALIWFLIGAVLTYVFMRNKTSADPTSYRDELDALHNKYDELRRKYLEMYNIQSFVDFRTRQVAPTEEQIKELQPEVVQVEAPKVAIFNTRTEDATAPTSGAKTQGTLPGEIDNDTVLGLKKENK